MFTNCCTSGRRSYIIGQTISSASSNVLVSAAPTPMIQHFLQSMTKSASHPMFERRKVRCRKRGKFDGRNSPAPMSPTAAASLSQLAAVHNDGTNPCLMHSSLSCASTADTSAAANKQTNTRGILYPRENIVVVNLATHVRIDVSASKASGYKPTKGPTIDANARCRHHRLWAVHRPTGAPVYRLYSLSAPSDSLLTSAAWCLHVSVTLLLECWHQITSIVMVRALSMLVAEVCA